MDNFVNTKFAGLTNSGQPFTPALRGSNLQDPILLSGGTMLSSRWNDANSPVVLRATSDARSRIAETMRELPEAITKNQGSLMDRRLKLEENKHIVRRLVKVNYRKNEHHPKWSKSEKRVRDVVYTGSLRKKWNE